MMRYTRLVTSMVNRDGPGTGFDHAGKSVKTGDYDRVIVDYDCAPYINRILVAAAL
jgi:hypothetical protein